MPFGFYNLDVIWITYITFSSGAGDRPWALPVIDSDFSQDQQGRVRSCAELQTAMAEGQVKSLCLKVTPPAPRKTMSKRRGTGRELQTQVRLTVLSDIYTGANKR
jgi:hypothetical protein